jgi:hypothetical protein
MIQGATAEQLNAFANLGRSDPGYYGQVMFGLSKAKLPVSDEERQWIDGGIRRLERLLGRRRMLECKVALPTPEYFPDRYDGTEASLQAMFCRVAERMQVDLTRVELEVFTDSGRAPSLVPYDGGEFSSAGGLYRREGAERMVVAINSTQFDDPVALVATLAHELGHVILLGPGLVEHDEPDMEPLNDLLTVFLGFGVFNGNSVFQFQQFADYRQQGWSTRRLGYLSEQQFGYALARFATERGERDPAWARYLNTNVGSYWKRSMAWIRENRGESRGV